MSTEHHRSGNGGTGAPVHSDVSFETRDISVSAVAKSLIYLAASVGISLFICIYALRFASELAEKNDPPPMPMRHLEGPTMPPEPKLQGVPGHETDPQLDLRKRIQEDMAANEAPPRWVDEKTGVAQIPVADAMKIIAEKGMPAFAGAPAQKK